MTAPTSHRPRSSRGALTFEALVALVIFALGALAVTSLSVRQLVATRYAARALARDQLVEATMADLEARPYDLEVGKRSLEPTVVDDLRFGRNLEAKKEEGDKIVLLTVTTWIEDKDGNRLSPDWSYQKRILRL